MTEQEKNIPAEDIPEESQVQEAPKPRYVPRPRWQIVMAWVLLAIVILAVISYYHWIANPYG